MEKQHQIIVEIAHKVRKWAENENNLRGGSHCLNGWCAIASAQLFREFEKLNIRAQIHMYEGHNSDHVFLSIEDYIIDITATQFSEFSKNKIVFMHTREAEVYEFYRIDFTFKSAAELRKFQIKRGWPVMQVAYDK